MSASEGAKNTVSVAEYRQIAEFRHRIREFLHFSEKLARENGIEPQQHQLMLAVKGLPEGMRPTISSISARLCLRHHSTVELANRLVSHGEHLLRKLSVMHWQQLQAFGPALSDSLGAIVEQANHTMRHSA